jgi:hypothetical protein
MKKNCGEKKDAIKGLGVCLKNKVSGQKISININVCIVMLFAYLQLVHVINAQ